MGALNLEGKAWIKLLYLSLWCKPAQNSDIFYYFPHDIIFKGSQIKIAFDILIYINDYKRSRMKAQVLNEKKKLSYKYKEDYVEGEKKGFNNGLNEGEKRGFTSGFSEGEKKGFTNGINEGEKREFNNGFNEREKKGFTNGIHEGYNLCIKKFIYFL